MSSSEPRPADLGSPGGHRVTAAHHSRFLVGLLVLQPDQNQHQNPIAVNLVLDCLPVQEVVTPSGRETSPGFQQGVQAEVRGPGVAHGRISDPNNRTEPLKSAF